MKDRGKVLFVDDEPRVLQALERQLRKTFAMATATSGADGLIALEQQGPFAVVVADMRMPNMDGIEFLQGVKRAAPLTVRMMLTGTGDMHTAVKAVNDGNVFRFLTKPCPTDQLVAMVEAGLEQYRLVRAEKELLEGTLNGAIKLLSDILSIVAPAEFSRAVALRSEARALGKSVGLTDTNDLELAAMFSPIACVTLPAETLARARARQVLSDDEARALERMSEVGSHLIANIPRLDRVARIVLYQDKHFDGSGCPRDDVAGQGIPLQSRILKVLRSAAEIEEREHCSRAQALDRMKDDSGAYDPAILQAISLASCATEERGQIATLLAVRVFELRNGDIVSSTVESSSGLRLLSPGQTVTPAMIERLRNFRTLCGIKEPINVVRS